MERKHKLRKNWKQKTEGGEGGMGKETGAGGTYETGQAECPKMGGSQGESVNKKQGQEKIGASQ